MRFIKSRLGSFVYGLTLPVEALRLILSRPVLIFWSLLPIAITLFLYGYVLSALHENVQNWIASYFASIGWDPEGWVAAGVLLMTKTGLIIVGAMTFSVVATVTASPFNDFLAESSEKWITPPLPPVKNASWKEMIRLIWVDIVKSIAAAGATLIAILFSWVPILNLIAFIAAFLLVTFQYISYAQTRRGLGFTEGFRFLWKYMYACAGFGAVIVFLFAIPFISSFALPLAVVGGTMLVAKAQGSSEGLAADVARLSLK